MGMKIETRSFRAIVEPCQIHENADTKIFNQKSVNHKSISKSPNTQTSKYHLLLRDFTKMKTIIIYLLLTGKLKESKPF